MSSSDLMVEGYPHGTPQGYEGGCRGAVCPTGDQYGLSCKIAMQKSRGDYQYQRLVKNGATIPEIADALGLVGRAPVTPVPAVPAPKPTPATAKGGRPLAAKTAPTPKTPEPPRMNAPESIATGNASGSTPVADQPVTTVERPAPKPGEIRAWAIARGYEVGATGKLPKAIVDHYWDVTGRLDTAATSTSASKPAPAETPAPDLPAAIAEHVSVLEAKLTDALIPKEQPAERPEWADVAAHADVEAARNLAVRLEQELARSEEQRAAGKAQHADSLRAADDVIRGVLQALGMGPDHDPILATTTIAEERNELVNNFMTEFAKRIELEERLARRTDERDTAEQRARTAETAVQLTLSKWGNERAANEASYALILDQARTINTLTDALKSATGPRPSSPIPDSIAYC
ncbi:Lsr2 family DNA-binding protein [Microbacterium saperdae]